MKIFSFEIDTEDDTRPMTKWENPLKEEKVVKQQLVIIR